MHLDVQLTSPSLHAPRQRSIADWAELAAAEAASTLVVGAAVVAVPAALARRAKPAVTRIDVKRMVFVCVVLWCWCVLQITY